MGLFDEFIDNVGEGKPRNFRPGCGISCSQFKLCESPKLKHIARRKGGILFLLDTPVKKQDTEGDVFLGSFKKYVMPILKDCEVNMDKVSVAFAVPCHGIDVLSLKGEAYEIQLDSCREYFDQVMRDAEPLLVIPMGKVATHMLLGSFEGRMSGVTFLDDLCFNMIPDQNLGYWVAPCISPRHLAELFKAKGKTDDAVFYNRKLKEFLTSVLKSDYKSFPDYKSLSDNIHIAHDVDEACHMLDYILRREPEHLAFDYETDGLKLERDDMGIVLVGLSFNDGTYAMPFYQENEEFIGLFKKIMTNRNIGKIAHHAKYEARCTLDKLGVLPHPWSWDTLYGARLLNNVSKSNLKYLTYVNFGISGYDTMERYMAADAEDREKIGDNARNHFREACEDPAVMQMALKYVGQDALYTFKLFEVQSEKVHADKHLSKGERLFRSFINPLVEVEHNGIAIDEKVLDESIEECKRLVDQAEKDIYEDTFLKKFWPAEEHEFSYTTDDLTKLLYEYGSIEARYTDKGKYADDAETLEDIGLPLCNKVLEARKYSKVLDTYLMNIKRESVYDKEKDDLILHSSFNLHIASTFRSSSSGGINMQNIPVRDPVQNKLIRSCMVPHKGTKIFGLDYKAMEVATGCCIHHDKNMLHFLETGGDMHKASAKGCMLYTDKEWEQEDQSLCKAIRQEVKGGFNFASFYGSYYKQTGTSLWKYVKKTPPLLEHLNSKGIETIDDYLDHMQTMDKNLWEVQFPEYGEWRKWQYKFYQEHGYVDLITGFRCYGPMSKNNSTNTPIQGSAAHVLLWAMSQTITDLKRHKLRSFNINEIHDAQYISAYPDEEEEVLSIAHKWMIDEVPNKFKWFTAPLAAELEFTELRENHGCWANLSEYGYI